MRRICSRRIVPEDARDALGRSVCAVADDDDASVLRVAHANAAAVGRRNVAATAKEPATAARLLDALSGQASAAGFQRWGLHKGARADALVLDVGAPGVSGVPAAHHLDALVFATDTPTFCEVYVAGRRVVENGHYIREVAIAERFREAMSALWDAQKTA